MRERGKQRVGLCKQKKFKTFVCVCVCECARFSNPAHLNKEKE